LRLRIAAAAAFAVCHLIILSGDWRLKTDTLSVAWSAMGIAGAATWGILTKKTSFRGNSRRHHLLNYGSIAYRPDCVERSLQRGRRVLRPAQSPFCASKPRWGSLFSYYRLVQG